MCVLWSRGWKEWEFDGADVGLFREQVAINFFWCSRTDHTGPFEACGMSEQGILSVEFDVLCSFQNIERPSEIFEGVDLGSEVDRTTELMLLSEIRKAEFATRTE